MAKDKNIGDDANVHVGDGDGCDNVQSTVGALPPDLGNVPVESPPTECDDGSESDVTPYWPYMPVTTIPLDQ